MSHHVGVAGCWGQFYADGGDVQLEGSQGSPTDAADEIDLTEPTLPLGDAVMHKPSAVLLVDLDTRQVVHVNPVAQQLAPDAVLPLRLDAWSDAAQLRDLGGELLSESTHPLSKVARGQPVDGQAVSAARGSDMGSQRLPMWVVAIPMHGAPGLEHHALVVMLPVGRRGAALEMRDRQAERDAPPGAQVTADSDLRSRAVLATGLSFTVADAREPELPLVWVNPAFTVATGYQLDDVVGRNCRFLQGPDTDPDVVDEIRDALRAGDGITTTLLNYRRDGSAFWNQLNISPIFGPDGELTHFVGIQADVTNKVEADLARDRALAAERKARAVAETAERRLRLMADASTQLSDALHLDEARRRLVKLLVPRMADFIVLLAADGHGRLDAVAVHHDDARHQTTLDRLAADLGAALRTGSATEVLLGPTGSRLLRDLDAPAARETRLSYLADGPYVDAASAFPTRSAVFVPLAGRQNSDEVLVLGRGPDREQLDEHDLEDAIDLGRRAGLLLENIRLFETQRSISEILQRSLLPDLPILPGIRSAARYHAGSRGAEVGGDFYELTPLDDGVVAMAVGDVVGHDMLAAAAMGHLQGLVRACVHDPGATPASVLSRVDFLMSGLREHTVASMVQAFLTPKDAGWEVTWSSGGHPPLVARLPDGRVELLHGAGGESGDNDPVLGLAPHVVRREHTVWLPHGSVLVGFTDGLIERRGESIDLGIRRLAHQVEVGPAAPIGLVEHLVDTLARDSDHEDDIALVAVALDPQPPRPRFS
jgi:PAS domain S-box-containing protein